MCVQHGAFLKTGTLLLYWTNYFCPIRNRSMNRSMNERLFCEKSGECV